MEKMGRHLHTFTFWCHFILNIQKSLSLKDLTMNLGKVYSTTVEASLQLRWNQQDMKSNTYRAMPVPTILELGKMNEECKGCISKGLIESSWFQGFISPKSKFKYFTLVYSFKHCPCFRQKWSTKQASNVCFLHQKEQHFVPLQNLINSHQTVKWLCNYYFFLSISEFSASLRTLIWISVLRGHTPCNILL